MVNDYHAGERDALLSALCLEGRRDKRAHATRGGPDRAGPQAERRVIILANPGLAPNKSATHSLVANLQMVLPGEIAPTHRHTPTAIRFVLEGSGATTIVDGEPVVMRPGDLV